MRRFTFILAILMIGSFFSSPVITATHAAGYPDHVINLIIPGTPGSIIDVTGRIIANDLSQILGVKVVPMDKPGASFTLGTDFVARSKPDGYTIVYTNTPALVHARAAEPETVPYDPDKDLEPLGLHLFFPVGLAVKADSPWKNFNELVEYARQNPGKIRCSTSGKYAASFFVMKMVESEAGIKFTQVPYKGGQAVVTALLGGHVESSFDATMKFTPHMKAGKLRILLTTKKMRDFPEIPTPQELGYKLELPSVFFAFYGPVGMPAEVKETLVKAIKKAVEIPESKEKIEKLGFVVEYRSPEQLKKMVDQEYKDAYEIMEKVGVHN